MGLREKLSQRLEEEVDKSQEDIAWALEKNPDAAETANDVMQTSIYVNLFKGLLVIGSVIYLFQALSLLQFSGVLYVLTGYGVGYYSDYTFRDLGFYAAVFLWLPFVASGFLKKLFV